MTTIKLPDNQVLVKTLVNRGLPRELFRAQPFVLNEHVRSIRFSEEDKVIRISRDKQLEHMQVAVSSGLKQPYTMVIASNPNDQRAKLCAAYVMAQAVKLKLTTVGIKMGMELPMWHWVSGSFADKLRDNPGDHKPSMLVLSNIMIDSTNVKLEKVRDLLHQFADIPRIVVVTGCDPVAFVNTKLRVAVQYCVNIGTAKQVQL